MRFITSMKSVALLGMALTLLSSCHNEPVDNGTFPPASSVNQTCPYPYNVQLSPIVNGNATLTWSAGSDEIQWEVAYGPIGFSAEATSSILCNTNSLQLSNLDPTQGYQFRVKAHCSVNTASGWCFPYTYQPPVPTCPPVSNIQVIRDAFAGTTARLTWMAGGGEQQWEIQIGVAYEAIGFGNVVATTSNSYMVTGLDPAATYDFYVRPVCDATTKGIWTGFVRLMPATAPTVSDYWPTSVNNDWIYAYQNLTNPSGEKRIESVNPVGGYTFAPEDDGLATGPVVKTLRKSAGDYLIKQGDMTFNAGGFNVNVGGYEYLLLRDYEAVGQTWSTTATSSITSTNPLFPPSSLQTVAEGKMLEKGITVTVNGRTFTDVIHIQLDVTQTSNITNNAYTEHYWFAKNIGPIKVTSTISGFPTTKTLTNVFLYE